MLLDAADLQSNMDHCRNLGLQHTLTKPMTHSDLFDVIVSLPIGSSGSASSDAQPPSQLKPLRRAYPQMQPLKILLAEDNLVNQNLAVAILKKLGHTVTVADNGEEALTALEKNTYDLVIMDIQMPKIDGLEATKAIRKREQQTGQHLPIIAMTAHAIKGDRERCLSAGMDEYISKPIHIEELQAVLSTVADQET